MAFDSIKTVESVEGAQVVGWPNAGQAGLNFYGQLYGLDRDDNEYEFYDPNLAWVSSDLDTDSQAWKDAVNVRKALNIAIDRQTIADTILSGFGAAQSIRDWMGHDSRANPGWFYPYDPGLAKSMLAEAGYPDGFEITLTPAIRGAPGEVWACEAVAQYWEAIGVNVKFQHLPYATIRPDLITRRYQGVTCHTVGVRLTPIIGASNYLTSSTFSYGTHHPWLEEHVTATQLLTNPVEIQAGELEIYNWMFDNAIMASIYKHDGIWPIGYLLEPGWQPTDYSEVRTATAFEYAQHR
jgi:ABC-type transport system substrate-binding protein